MCQKADPDQSELPVRIERLEPMRAARFHAFGRNPEQAAWAALRQWAEPRGLLKDAAAHPVFGFNNPSPASPAEEYGYEFLLGIGAEAATTGDVETVQFEGGWYAVVTHAGLPNPGVWMRLMDWVRHSPHRYRRAHELERPQNPLGPESELVFDLYLPIEPGVALPGSGSKIRGVDFVMYPVSNLTEAARFYREILGLRQEVYSEEWQWAEFNCGNVTLALKGGEKRPEQVTGGRIALAVEDVHAAWTELRSKGVRVLGEPVDYGVCCAVEVLDLDGNTLILHKRADGTCA